MSNEPSLSEQLRTLIQDRYPLPDLAADKLPPLDFWRLVAAQGIAWLQENYPASGEDNFTLTVTQTVTALHMLMVEQEAREQRQREQIAELKKFVHIETESYNAGFIDLASCAVNILRAFTITLGQMSQEAPHESSR